MNSLIDMSLPKTFQTPSNPKHPFDKLNTSGKKATSSIKLTHQRQAKPQHDNIQIPKTIEVCFVNWCATQNILNSDALAPY